MLVDFYWTFPPQSLGVVLDVFRRLPHCTFFLGPEPYCDDYEKL